MYVVKQGFSTQSRRFSPGDKVEGRDLDGPVPVQRRIELGHIEPFVEPEPVDEAPTDGALPSRPRRGGGPAPAP
ncbi:hypothetical protein [Niveispirillum sp.]|uniref:hypothetical protein n=1 Tax=Niveispirillum sp. TaxID=1917217 RepID=UPI001B405F45|nr:hypothetical protein [Niveispirillum sp.]MBP7339094.1 hypothetical protein [Niveispirillum sp.]